MNFKLVHRITGLVVFLFASVVYLMTVQPTMSFWDCGEFLACAFTIGVPHPPGAPLHILVGRIFTMIPVVGDIGLRMNFLSVFSSSLSVLLLYLLSVRVIRNWRGPEKDWFDTIVLTIPSAIGALSLAFADSFWFNAMEAEVYGFGTLLLTLSIYLLMRWWDKAEEPGADKYLFIVAYIAGLALGIHLLVVQVIFLAGLMFYFKRYEFNWKSFFIAIGLSALAFFIVYPFITKKLPSIISGAPEVGFFVVIAVLLGAIYWAFKNDNRIGKLAFLSIFLVIVGYSTYISAYMRAGVDNLPVDNNDPSNMERLLSYLNREQYGEQPLIWPRRYSQEPQHERTWKLYSSDVEFLWKYQINEMFNRYLFWQYIGRAGYNQGDGVDFTKFYGIPFILGMLGLFYHFKRDKKLAFVFLMMFIMLGVITALYQNQQDPQPRERDYFYIGAFFAFSLWIGLGVASILEMIKEFVKTKAYVPVSFAFLAFGIIFVPLNMLRHNYHYQNRAENYFPYDYAYNLLQSCDKDAILITNGDNDTFPLWCLQATYGIRTDVRIVNLSLGQIDWYNLQLKNETPYGAKKVPMTLSDEQVRQLRPVEWDERKVLSIEVPKSAYPDSMQNSGNTPERISFKVPASVRFQQGGKTVTALKVNDLLVLDIIKANKWQRPIYFSVTVTEDNYVGLGEYLRMEGMAQRLMPYKVIDPTQGVGIDVPRMWKNLMEPVNSMNKEPQYGMVFRGLNNPDLFYDQTQMRMIEGYRMLYIRLAHTLAQDSSTFGKAREVLDMMDKNLPKATLGMDYRIQYDVAMLCLRINYKEGFEFYAQEAEKTALEERKKGQNSRTMESYYNPYRILLDIYEGRQDYNKAMEILNELQAMNPNDASVKLKMQNIRNKMEGKPDTLLMK